MFPFILARHLIAGGPGSFRPWEVERLLDRAEKLARALPADPKQKDLLDTIHKGQQMVAALNPFGRLFAGGPLEDMMDVFGFPGDVDDEEYDDEDY
jgi:hypothetical protein